MSLARLYLLVVGGFSVLIGIAYIVQPARLAALVDLPLSSPTARIEVQGFYGGQLLGLGAAMLLGVWRPGFVVAGLLAAAASLGGTAIGRILGVMTAGSFPPVIAVLLFVETAAACLAGFLLRRELRATSS